MVILQLRSMVGEACHVFIFYTTGVQARDDDTLD